MAENIDTTSIPTCKTGNSAAFAFSPAPLSFDLPVLRDMCASVPGMTLDHVYRVIDVLDEHGGRRELGDLVDAISDAERPLGVIEMMIDHDLIRFAPGHAFDAALPIERIA